MSTVIRSIDVDVPVATAYNELVRFEDLPRFMPGVVAVNRRGERHLSWHAQLFGVVRIWELELIEIVPERRIAWESRSGPRNSGTIELEPLSAFDTRLTMAVRYDPASFVAEVTDYFGMLDRWVERSLARFQDVVVEPHARCRHLPAAEELVGQ